MKNLQNINILIWFLEKYSEELEKIYKNEFNYLFLIFSFALISVPVILLAIPISNLITIVSIVFAFSLLILFFHLKLKNEIKMRNFYKLSLRNVIIKSSRIYNDVDFLNNRHLQEMFFSSTSKAEFILSKF